MIVKEKRLGNCHRQFQNKVIITKRTQKSSKIKLSVSPACIFNKKAQKPGTKIRLIYIDLSVVVRKQPSLGTNPEHIFYFLIYDMEPLLPEQVALMCIQLH